VPAALVGGTLKSAGVGAAGTVSAAAGISATVDTLAKGVMGTMAIKKAVTVAGLVLATVLTVSGLGVGTRYLFSGPAEQGPKGKPRRRNQCGGPTAARKGEPPLVESGGPPKAGLCPGPKNRTPASASTGATGEPVSLRAERGPSLQPADRSGTIRH